MIRAYGPTDNKLMKTAGKFRVGMKVNIISSIGEFASDAIFNACLKRQVEEIQYMFDLSTIMKYYPTCQYIMQYF
jgi:hypothetical protein